MSASAILLNPAEQRWLGGVEPAWTLLDRASLTALHRPPSPTAGPIRLATDLTHDEIQQSAVARNALILLRAAAADPGLKLTATGNLSRGVVAELCDLFTWPEFDKTAMFQVSKVINEPDFLPLLFVRQLVAAAKLLRRHKGHFTITPAGRKLLEDSDQRAVQAILFHLALWHLNLGYFATDLHHGWPQGEAGIVLWCLSVAANDWQSRERLTRLCTIPIDDVLESKWNWDTAAFATQAKILRPLHWFGLLEHRTEKPEPGSYEGRQSYRKTALFDRFLSFEVTLEHTSAPCH